MEHILLLKKYIREQKSLPTKNLNFELFRWMHNNYRRLERGQQKGNLKILLQEIRKDEEFKEYFKVDINKKRDELNDLMSFLDKNKRKPKGSSSNKEERKACWIWRKFRDSWGLYLYTNREEVDNIFKEFMDNDKYGVYFRRDTDKWSLKLEKFKNYIIENNKIPTTGKLNFWHKYQKRRCNERDLTYNNEIIALWNEFINSDLYKNAN